VTYRPGAAPAPIEVPVRRDHRRFDSVWTGRLVPATARHVNG